MRRPAARATVLAAAVVVLALVPLAGGQFAVDFVTKVMVFAILALSLELLVGVVDTFGKVFFPQAAGVLVYVLMALVLLWRPGGLFKAT